MEGVKYDPVYIEEREKEVLLELAWFFKGALDEFGTSLDRSLRYLERIILPIVMASKKDRSYNPFAEIVEKYALHILYRKLEKYGYHLLPLGYSSDLTLENEKHILNVDVKTASLDNPSDFNRTINVGINQMTHAARLKINGVFLPSPYFVYPNLPPFYEMGDSGKKLILTYGFVFIYPSYRDVLDSIRRDYSDLFAIFNQKIVNVLAKLQEFSNVYKDKKMREKLPVIAENLIRGIFIHEYARNEILNSIKISKSERKLLEKFAHKLKNIAQKLRERNIKPVAIIMISLPNGLLKERYLKRFVSGKSYGRSARYHYENGIFEFLKEKTGKEFPRVIFVDLKEEYLSDLRKYFGRINLLDYRVRRL